MKAIYVGSDHEIWKAYRTYELKSKMGLAVIISDGKKRAK